MAIGPEGGIPQSVLRIPNQPIPKMVLEWAVAWHATFVQHLEASIKLTDCIAEPRIAPMRISGEMGIVGPVGMTERDATLSQVAE